MGVPSKLANESVISISGSAEFNTAYPTFINFIEPGVATGSTYASRAKSPLEYTQNLITSLSSALGAGAWDLGSFVYKGTTYKVTVTGSSGFFGEINASRVELTFTNAVAGGVKTVRYDGRFVIDPYDFKIGYGDSVSKIYIEREPNSSGVKALETLDVSLSFSSDGIWSGSLIQHIRNSTKASGEYSGYTYQTTTVFSGVNVSGVSVDQRTIYSDEKVTSNAYRAYGADGKLLWSSVPSSIKAINLETDIGLAHEVALSGNTLVSLSGSHTSTVRTYNGDDWITDNSSGSNKIDGGSGNDLVEYLSSSSNFTLTRKDSETIIVSRGTESNELINVEIIGFPDKTIASNEVKLSSTPPGTYRLSVIVNAGVLGPDPVLLKDLKEDIVGAGAGTTHTVVYGTSKFNYIEIDALIMTVVRDGEFTDEFRKEIADQYPSFSSISYKEATLLVGQGNIDQIIIGIAGADGNFVG